MILSIGAVSAADDAYTARHANDIDVKDNIIEEDNAIPEQSTRKSSTYLGKIELDESIKQMGDEVGEEIR
ncbi:hypothetical protein [uncultured Methanobrevibacter sp.]|uniref:hypothetical protein n=1 Tax=uncultured Methanobrevibacter sp. TaxID=253161 RepID=UPI0025E821C0|nr:hypothetical protein [uncultured Methanobrevibacter sp.]